MVRSAPMTAFSTVGTLRSLSPLYPASQVHSAATGPSVAGVAAPPRPEQVSEGHEDGTDDDGITTDSELFPTEGGCDAHPVGEETKQASI